MLLTPSLYILFFFFFNDTATTEIYTLSLHDALPIRSAVSPSFAVAVKLNSADFQRGGFDADDAQRVIAMLAPLGVDLVELSGGNYESPAMSGRPADEKTAPRAAYFLDLATELVE